MAKIYEILILLFVFDGSRVRRKTMWFFFIPYGFALNYLVPRRDQIEILVIMAVLIYAFVVVSVKRWQDRGKSPYWVIIGFIPIIQFWAGIELLFLPSKQSSNELR